MKTKSGSMEPPTNLLKAIGLRRTAAREAILQLLESAGRPLSHQDIYKRLQRIGSFDRVTVYRTLETLLEAGLLHRIQATNGTWRFCRHTSSTSGKCSGNHIHFLCSKCDRMSCLPEQPLPWVLPPAGAVIHSKQLVVHGFCAGCVTKAKATGKGR